MFLLCWHDVQHRWESVLERHWRKKEFSFPAFPAHDSCSTKDTAGACFLQCPCLYHPAAPAAWVLLQRQAPVMRAGWGCIQIPAASSGIPAMAVMHPCAPVEPLLCDLLSLAPQRMDSSKFQICNITVNSLPCSERSGPRSQPWGGRLSLGHCVSTLGIWPIYLPFLHSLSSYYMSNTMQTIHHFNHFFPKPCKTGTRMSITNKETESRR